MPLALHQYLPDSTELGVWHITESESELVNRLQLNDDELSWLKTITHDKRYLHWLGSRVLIRWMLQTDQFIQLSANEYKKPILTNFPHEVSISHSNDMAAVIISERQEVGIDLEQIHPKVWKVKERFLSQEELAQIDLSDETAGTKRLIQYWCAKEALFKLFARGNVDFRRELLVEPGPGKDMLYGTVKKPGMQNPYLVHTYEMEGYMLAYVMGKVDPSA